MIGSRHVTRLPVAWLAIALSLATNAGSAEPQTQAVADWPQWRGPHRDAVSAETGLLKEWPTNGPTLAWELTGLGKGYSSVVIAGGTLFTMGNIDAQYMLAFKLSDRSLLWKAKVGAPNDQAHSTPTVDGDLVYTIGTAGDVVCVKVSDGSEVWRKSLTVDFGGKAPGWNFSESPLIDGDKLVCTPGGDSTVMVALNKKTGAVVWKYAPTEAQKPGLAAHASIVVSEAAGVRQYVTLMQRGAVGVSAADGKLLWVYPRVANGTANIATPVVVSNLVFVSTAYNTGSALLRLEKSPDGVKAEEVYFLGADKFQCHHGGFLRVGDYIYGAHGHNAGNPVCIKMATGDVMWKENQLGKGSGSLVYADGNLYFRWEDDTVALIEANPERYVLKGQFKIPSRPGADGPGWAHPVVQGGKLYIRHGDVLFCYDVKAKQK